MNAATRQKWGGGRERPRGNPHCEQRKNTRTRLSIARPFGPRVPRFPEPKPRLRPTLVPLPCPERCLFYSCFGPNTARNCMKPLVFFYFYLLSFFFINCRSRSSQWFAKKNSPQPPGAGLANRCPVPINQGPSDDLSAQYLDPRAGWGLPGG